jgi:hypothetical protein
MADSQLTEPPARLAEVVVVDHDQHRILIDGLVFPYMVGENVTAEQVGHFGTVDLTLLAEKVTVVGTPSPRRVTSMGTTIGAITGAILVRVGDADPAELGTFTLPVRTTTRPSGTGVTVNPDLDRLRRAMAAFSAVLDEED